MPRLPSLVFAVVFIVMALITQLLAYQQYKISKEKQKNELVQEAAAAKDRFRNILFSDVAAANTLAIIYKQYGVPAKFDSIVSQILSNSRYAQALQITENGIVKNVYPDSLYKGTIGTNVNADPVRKAEEARAVDHKDIYFAGPRRLRFGDTGILGKVPIIINNKVKAVATVLTRLSVVKKGLEHANVNKRKFAYQLLKVRNKEISSFPLSATKPANESEYIDTEIPEGDWLLRVSYSDSYTTDKFPYELSGMGILLSFAAGLLAYRKVREPYKLNEIIDIKTAQANKANKELNLLNQINDIILSEEDINILYKRVCDCIVASGDYQFARICHISDVSTADQITKATTVALPLDIGDSKSAALCIYAKKTNAFDQDEVITLNRLAANLSIAVQNIGIRREKESTRHQLQERVKELTTIYKVNQILQQEHVNTNTRLQEIVEVLPPGWQYPEVCEARILFNGEEYKTRGYRDSTFKQTADFGLLDGRKGSVEVIYTENMPAEAEGLFLKEERNLINSIAEAIEVYFDEDIQRTICILWRC